MVSTMLNKNEANWDSNGYFPICLMLHRLCAIIIKNIRLSFKKLWFLQTAESPIFGFKNQLFLHIAAKSPIFLLVCHMYTTLKLWQTTILNFLEFFLCKRLSPWNTEKWQKQDDYQTFLMEYYLSSFQIIFTVGISPNINLMAKNFF